MIQLSLFDLDPYTIKHPSSDSEPEPEATVVVIEPPVTVESIQLVLPGFEPYFEFLELEPVSS